MNSINNKNKESENEEIKSLKNQLSLMERILEKRKIKKLSHLKANYHKWKRIL